MTSLQKLHWNFSDGYRVSEWLLLNPVCGVAHTNHVRKVVIATYRDNKNSNSSKVQCMQVFISVSGFCQGTVQ